MILPELNNVGLGGVDLTSSSKQGMKRSLSDYDQFLITMFWLAQYPPQELFAVIFNMYQSQLMRIVQRVIHAMYLTWHPIFGFLPSDEKLHSIEKYCEPWMEHTLWPRTFLQIDGITLQVTLTFFLLPLL